MGRISIKQLTPVQQKAQRDQWRKNQETSRAAQKMQNQKPGEADEVAFKTCSTYGCDIQPTIRLHCKHRRCATCIGEELYWDPLKRHFCTFCKKGRVASAAKIAELVHKASLEYPEMKLQKAIRDAVNWTSKLVAEPVDDLRAKAQRKRIERGTRVMSTFQVRYQDSKHTKSEDYFGTVLGFTLQGHVVVEWESASIVSYPDPDDPTKINKDAYGVVHITETKRCRNQSRAPSPPPDEVLEYLELT